MNRKEVWRVFSCYGKFVWKTECVFEGEGLRVTISAPDPSGVLAVEVESIEPELHFERPDGSVPPSVMILVENRDAMEAGYHAMIEMLRSGPKEERSVSAESRPLVEVVGGPGQTGPGCAQGPKAQRHHMLRSQRERIEQVYVSARAEGWTPVVLVLDPLDPIVRPICEALVGPAVVRERISKSMDDNTQPLIIAGMKLALVMKLSILSSEQRRLISMLHGGSMICAVAIGLGGNTFQTLPVPEASDALSRS